MIKLSDLTPAFFIHIMEPEDTVYFRQLWLGWSKVQGIFSDLDVGKHVITQYCLSAMMQKMV